jgi:quinol monooxygenase YgiN
MIYVLATLTIQKGTLPQIKAAVAPCLAATRLEKGCISYDLFEDINNPETLSFIERWETREDLAAHFHAPHLKTWREAGGKYILARKIEIIHAGEIERL